MSRSIRGATGSRVTRVGIPREWPPLEEAERRRGSDGAEYAHQSRVVDIDPLEQRATYEMRAAMWLDDELAREELHTLHLNYYFTNELRLMLEEVGFADIVLHGDHQEASLPRETATSSVLIGNAYEIADPADLAACARTVLPDCTPLTRRVRRAILI